MKPVWRIAALLFPVLATWLFIGAKGPLAPRAQIQWGLYNCESYLTCERDVAGQDSYDLYIHNNGSASAQSAQVKFSEPFLSLNAPAEFNVSLAEDHLSATISPLPVNTMAVIRIVGAPPVIVNVADELYSRSEMRGPQFTRDDRLLRITVYIAMAFSLITAMLLGVLIVRSNREMKNLEAMLRTAGGIKNQQGAQK